MRRKKAIPEKPRFERVRKRAYHLLFELEICQLPVDPFFVAERLQKVYVQKWTELKDKFGKTDPLNIDCEGADAKTHIIRGREEYLVVYDDRVESSGRIRWTIAHEIGHIVLGHLVHFEATSLCRGSLTENEYKVLEREADCFAVNLLAPMCIVRRLTWVRTREDFKKLCGLSGEASDNCLEELSLLNSGQRILFPTKEEDELYRLFFKFINEENHTTVPALCYDDIEIDEEYEDYLECDYWGFIVSVIKDWKRKPEISEALEGSLALYDCEDMVVFLKQKDKVDLITKNEDILIESLQIYADSCVKRLKVYAAATRNTPS